MIESQFLGNISIESHDDISGIRGAKLTEARRFIDRLPKRNILFAGVSGSVSYEPGVNDDIDIFLITKTNKLWSELFKAFLVRRLFGTKDICISLAFDHSFASTYFRDKISGLPKRDSVQVVNILGGGYYRNLLLSSPRIGALFMEMRKEDGNRQSSEKDTHSRIGVVETCCFLVLSCWLELKELYSNRRIREENRHEDAFSTIKNLHRFYLESERYKRLDRLFRNGEDSK